MDELLGSILKKYASCYFELKIGHNAIGKFLTRIGVIKTPKYWWCGEAKQFIEYLYTKCWKQRKQKRKLIRSLSAKNFGQQGWTKKKGLAKLIADERILELLLKFLKVIEKKKREKARKKKLE